MKPIVYAVSAALLVAAGAPAPAGRPETVRSCEPSGLIDVYAKTLEVREQGAVATVTVELTILPHRKIEGAVIRGLADGTAFDRAFGISDRIETLRRRVVRKVQYSLDLERGMDHHLYFEVGGEGPDGPVTVTAYLRVNLDPDLQPEELEDVIQYRAVMQGETP